MSTTEKLKNILGIKNPEEAAMERQEAIQREQLDIQRRISPVEAAQSMSLMKNANSDGQYELGALALDPDPDIEEFKSLLRGYRYVQTERNGRVVLEKDKFGEPLMNNDGINYFVQNLRLYSSKSFVLTNYAGKDKGEQGLVMIHDRCLINAEEIIKTICINEINWNIDMAKIFGFFELYTNYVESCLLRSLDSKTATNYWGSQKSIQHTTQQINDAPIKKSMFGSQ